jgi:septal ring factor EnvC (AmiA/AmiB activator)
MEKILENDAYPNLFERLAVFWSQNNLLLFSVGKKKEMIDKVDHLERQLQEKERMLEENGRLLKEKERMLKEKERMLKEKENEIDKLKHQLTDKKNKQNTSN